MLGAALIVFRESFEAALLIGILAAAMRLVPGRSRWLAIGIAAGVVGALMIAGIAVGVAVYAGLLRIPSRRFFTVVGTLLVLLASGLASQMARFLVQADWLPPLASPLWDTSWLLANGSVLGGALRVLIGYEA